MATFTRHEVMSGNVVGAPTCCGVVMKNNRKCDACPIYFTAGQFTCGNHKPQISHRHTGKIVGECSICLCDIKHPKDTLTSCNHRFHIKCLSKWKGTGNTTCPLCRTVIFTPTQSHFQLVPTREEQYQMMVWALPGIMTSVVIRIDNITPVLEYPVTILNFLNHITWCPDQSLNGQELIRSAIFRWSDMDTD